jgi:hypothetical protein
VPVGACKEAVFEIVEAGLERGELGDGFLRGGYDVEDGCARGVVA